MAIDGWSNLTNRPFLAILLDNDLFYTLDTTGLSFAMCQMSPIFSLTGCSHTGEYLLQVVEEAIAKVRAETKAIVAGLFPKL